MAKRMLIVIMSEGGKYLRVKLMGDQDKFHMQEKTERRELRQILKTNRWLQEPSGWKGAEEKCQLELTPQVSQQKRKLGR